MSQEYKQSIIGEITKERDISVTSSLVPNITFRGEWIPDTIYNIGDYVYTPKSSGFFYVATTAGKSQSKIKGKSGESEPIWKLDGSIYDNVIQWKPIEVDESDVDTLRTWSSTTIFQLNEIIIPSSGVLKFIGATTTYIAFKASSFNTTPLWSMTPDSIITDGSIKWETHVSYSRLLPPARRSEALYKEVCEIMDYLYLHENYYFNDIKHKFNDRTKVRTASLNQIIEENGYDYISKALNLNDGELRSLISYLGMISAFKGHKSGLEMIFELLQIEYHMEEWWEQSPKGEADTWNLYLDLNVEKAVANVVNRVVNFTRNYVYPVLKTFEVKYLVDMIKVDIFSGGFIEKVYDFDCNTGSFSMVSCGGFIDKEYAFHSVVTILDLLGFDNTLNKFGFGETEGNIKSWQEGNWNRSNMEDRTAIQAETENKSLLESEDSIKQYIRVIKPNSNK